MISKLPCTHRMALTGNPAVLAATGVNSFDLSMAIFEAKARPEIETCFAAGTLVHTKEGLRPIEELKVGDWVLTWPEDMPIPRRARLPDEYIYKPVTKTFVHEDTVISHVPLLGSGVGKDEVLRVTPNHLVYAERRGWLPISALKPSYPLVWADFSNASVRRMKHDVERVTVYNIEVEDCHTYFVGKLGLWVHNKREQGTQLNLRPIKPATLSNGEFKYELRKRQSHSVSFVMGRLKNTS